MPHAHQKLDRVSVKPGATLGTLAGRTSIQLAVIVNTQNLNPALWQGNMDCRGMALDESISVYAADGELGQAEVEEAIESAPLHSRDQPALEHTRRPVQWIGKLTSLGLAIDLGNRLPMFRENIGFKLWGYNNTDAALTTGGVASGALWLYFRFAD